MRQMRVFLVILLILLLPLCGSASAQKLPEGFSEADVKTDAARVHDLLGEKDTKALLDICTVAMQEALTEEVMEKVYAAVAEAGEFGEILEIRIHGSKDKASGEEFAVALVSVQYELKKMTYTISFTRQMKLAGLFYR